MSRNFLCSLLLLFTSLSGGVCFAQNISNEGTEFYSVFPSHVPSNNRLAAYSIFITGKQSSSGTVSVGSFSVHFEVVANTVTEIDIPRGDAYIADSEAGRPLPGRAIHIVVDPGKPRVVVYGHIFAGARSAASLILPVGAMGQQYYSMNYTNSPNADGGTNYLVVVASEANTKVLVRRNGVEIIPGGITLANAGDVYEYLSAGDLTGTEIVIDSLNSPCKRFAVFSGHTNVIIRNGSCPGGSSDPLYQQNYPVDSWGTTYGFVPFSSGTNTRSAGSIYRVLAKDNGTEVRVNGTLVATLNSGAFYQSAAASVNAALITASKPVAVAQYALSQACAGGGVSDPDMVILNPVEYNIKNITVYSSREEDITEQYINVLIATSAAASFRVNGVPAAGTFTRLGTTPYSYIKLNVSRVATDNFVLSASEGFNAIAYGFGAFESYAYSAGTNLASTQTLSAIKIETQEELPNACTREDFRFKLVLPEIALRLYWKFGEADPGITEDLPVGTPVVKNGKTMYQYFYPRTQQFDTPGQRLVTVLAQYTNATGCYTTEQEITFIFDVYDPPQADFEADSIVCPNIPVIFTDKSIDNGKAIANWNWNFGDGTSSTLQNPTHTYARSGTFTIILNVGNGTGCLAQTYSRQITVRPLPVAVFTVSGISCDANEATFTDASVAGEGTVTTWLWDFGDSTTLSRTTGSTFRHTFPRPGIYSVKLRIINSAGCSSGDSALTVTVYAPTLDAGPDRLILTGGETKLKISATGNNLKYKWSPSTGLDRDDIASPAASPTVDITYTITITSEEGCVLSDEVNVKVIQDFLIPNTFTPNGDGINDVWTLQYLDTYPDVIVTVFNRLGEKMYVSVGYTSPWNGQSNGKDVPVGTYYYLIQPKNNKKPFSGYVTVLR